MPPSKDPSVNYIGQIIGPQGVTQQKLEKESRCRIQIRGAGSQTDKTKMFSMDGKEEEPLHVLVTAESEEDLDKGCGMITAIIH